MENAPRNDAARGREQGSCSRKVTTVTITGYLLLTIGFSLLAGCATVGKAKVEPSNSGIEKSLERLAKYMPARYGKPKVLSESVASLFEIERPAPPAAPVVKGEAPAVDTSSAATVGQGEGAARAAEGNEGNEHGKSAKE